MVIDWLKFLPALVLLLTPGSLFYGKKTRYRDISRDWDGHWTRILSHGLHAIDLVRAALGTWLLLDALTSLPEVRGLARHSVPLTQGSIRVLAVLVQTAICRERDSANAPFAFVTGLLLAGLSPLAATIALALAIPLAMGARTPAAFFPVLAIAHFGVGFWFYGKARVLSLCFSALASTLPLLWAFLFHRELVIAYRARRLTDENRPDPIR